MRTRVGRFVCLLTGSPVGVDTHARQASTGTPDEPTVRRLVGPVRNDHLAQERPDGAKIDRCVAEPLEHLLVGEGSLAGCGGAPEHELDPAPQRGPRRGEHNRS